MRELFSKTATLHSPCELDIVAARRVEESGLSLLDLDVAAL
jgi:hypothetical protein